MHLVIYDTEHFETTYALVRILDTPKHSITLFVTPVMAHVLKGLFKEDMHKYKWVIKKPNEVSFIYRLYQYCSTVKAGYLYLNTVAHHHILFGVLCILLPKTKTILTVHDVNSLFNPTLRFSAKPILRYIGKKVLAGAASEYAVLLENCKRYLQAGLGISKKITVLPGSVYEGNPDKAVRQLLVFTVVIPGSIDNKRRNYELILCLMEQLKQASLYFQIVILGSARTKWAKSFQKKIKQASTENSTVRIYESYFVDQVEYDEQLSRCQLVLLPLVTETTNDAVTETYGQTKASGGFFDAVRHAKPVLLPAQIPVSPELEEQCVPYHSLHHLVALLLLYADNEKEYFRLAERAQRNSLNFTPESIRAQLTHPNNDS